VDEVAANMLMPMRWALPGMHCMSQELLASGNRFVKDHRFVLRDFSVPVVYVFATKTYVQSDGSIVL